MDVCIQSYLIRNDSLSLPVVFRVDSVVEGDKVVKTAIDNFGRIGMIMSIYIHTISVLQNTSSVCTCIISLSIYRHSHQQCWVC